MPGYVFCLINEITAGTVAAVGATTLLILAYFTLNLQNPLASAYTT